MWDPRLLAAGDRAAARTGRRASLAVVPEAAFLLAGLAGGAGPASRPAPRALAAGALGAAVR